MIRQEIRFLVISKDGVVEHIGRSKVWIPAIRFSGGKTKWFDDTKLIKPRGKETQAVSKCRKGGILNEAENRREVPDNEGAI